MKTKIFTTTIIRALMLAVLSFATITSCKSDDDETPAIVYPDQNPLDGYLSATGFNQSSTIYTNAGSYEFGVEFTPNVKGKIKAITAKLPAINNNLKVTIWDATTKTVLRTEVINVSSVNTLITATISDLALEKDKKYAITMNSDDWYQRNKTDLSNTTYPVTSGNITIHRYGYRTGSTQTYPTSFPVSYYAGDLSFVFQQTE